MFVLENKGMKIYEKKEEKKKHKNKNIFCRKKKKNI